MRRGSVESHRSSRVDQTKGVSKPSLPHHNHNRNHDDLEKVRNPKDQEGVHDGKGFFSYSYYIAMGRLPWG